MWLPDDLSNTASYNHVQNTQDVIPLSVSSDVWIVLKPASRRSTAATSLPQLPRLALKANASLGSSGCVMSLQHAGWHVDDWSEEPRNIREKALAARAWQNESPALVGKPVRLVVYAAAAVDSSLWMLKTSWIRVYQIFPAVDLKFEI